MHKTHDTKHNQKTKKNGAMFLSLRHFLLMLVNDN